jgi:PilZ domain
MPERRQNARTAPEKHIYIGFGTNNGGIVSDVSVTGLGFCAVAPVPSSGMITFWFSRHPTSKITAIGEIVWRDETQRRGGLRFTQLPTEARQALGITQATTIETRAVIENLNAEVNSPKPHRKPTASSGLASDLRCPQCGSANLRKVCRKTIWERYVMPVFHLRPYRCINCYGRFLAAAHSPKRRHD